MVCMLANLLISYDYIKYEHRYRSDSYLGPSPNNNDDSFYKQTDQFSYHYIFADDKYRSKFSTDHPYHRTVSVFKVSLLETD